MHTGYKRCPHCGEDLEFEKGSEKAIAHLAAHVERARLAGSEVEREEIELGCENLAPRVVDPDPEC